MPHLCKQVTQNIWLDSEEITQRTDRLIDRGDYNIILHVLENEWVEMAIFDIFKSMTKTNFMIKWNEHETI